MLTYSFTFYKKEDKKPLKLEEAVIEKEVNILLYTCIYVNLQWFCSIKEKHVVKAEECKLKRGN